MRICIAYIAVTLGPITPDYASRFVATFLEYPPEADADLMVICNGGPLSTELSMIFAPLEPVYYPRENDPGWDVTAYLDAARGPCKDYDMMLCLGESNYFHRPCWLRRLVNAREKHGPGMYSSYSSNAVRPHMNTTAFFCAPSVLLQYPHRPTNWTERMEFEHGQTALWRRLQKRGMQTRLVTWDGEYEPRMWRSPRNILWRGDQSNLLMWCNHSDGFLNADQKKKGIWARYADTPFK